MNRHELIDIGTVRLTGLLLRNQKLFGQSIETPPLVDTAVEATATVDDVTTAGRHDVTVDTPIGSFEAAYLPWQWLGAEYPTIIYHHGSGEQPFDFGRFSSNTFRRVFVAADPPFPANIIAVQAPFHGGSQWEYIGAMGRLSNFVGMVASSTALVEAISSEVVERTESPVFLVGTSLGGFVVNLHRSCFGTATHYLPCLSWAALGELFTSSAYSHLVAPSALQRSAHLREILGFESAFRAVDADDCSPLLCRYDQIVEYDSQRPSYDGMRLKVLDKGHITGALATEILREQVYSVLDDVQ
jgi:hypothetical protein